MEKPNPFVPSIGGIWKITQTHGRRIVLIVVNFLFNHDCVFAAIGLINKKIKIIESVFLAYPANDQYALAYAYPYRIKRSRWDPYLTGLLVQNWKVTIAFCISANNGQFTDLANHQEVCALETRMETIRKLFNARRKTFAGIIPGVLYLKRIIREAPEADLTAKVVKQAIEKVKALEMMPVKTPVIILGGRGFIGRRVVQLLPPDLVHSIDVRDANANQWPNQLRGKRVLVVNITIKNSLQEYVDWFWPEMVILNEVYPEPPSETLAAIKAKGISCYHIKGVKAKAIPEFPGAYTGAIPCCAAWPADELETALLKLI